MSIVHIQSLISVMTSVLEYIITRCQISHPGPSASHSRNMSQSQHNMEQTQLSNSTDFQDKSYDDERRSLIEQIKSLLVAKIEAISKTVSGIDLNRELSSIKNWKIVEIPPLHLAMNSYESNSVTSRNTFKNFNSQHTVNFQGAAGSLYNGTLGVQSSSSG